MRVLVNAATLVVGGAVQVAVATIRESFLDPASEDWHFVVSAQVMKNLEIPRGVASSRFHVCSSSPARSWAERRRIAAIEKALKPSATFTVFGPAFVRFESPHLMGCANGWVTHPSPLALQTQPGFIRRTSRIARSWYASTWLRKADCWVTETESARHGMAERLGIPYNKIAVVSNTCARHYLEQQRSVRFPDARERLRFLCFAAGYPHKCLDLVPDVARALLVRVPDRMFEFVLTLPPDSMIWRTIQRRAHELGVSDRVCNVGTVPVSCGPEVYQSCHLTFLPTVLETFSATYPESMAMGLPIVTSNLDFARDICGGSAVYFSPRDADNAADAIARLLQNRQRWQELVIGGRERLQSLPSPSQKYLAYRELIERLVANRSFQDFEVPATSLEANAA